MPDYLEEKPLQFLPGTIGLMFCQTTKYSLDVYRNNREILYLSCNYNYLHMGLMFINFSGIIQGNLMPWLDENQDPEKFRIILRKLAKVKPMNSSIFFGALATTFMDMGINPGQKLIDEWGILTETPWHPETPDIIEPFLQLSDNNPKLVFYNKLIAHSMAALFSMITIQITEDRSETLVKHRVMGYMKGLSMMISHVDAVQATAADDRTIISRLLAGLAILFAEAWNRFAGSFEPSMLRISKADISNILSRTDHDEENTRGFFNTLAERYFPVHSIQSDLTSGLTVGEIQNRMPMHQNELAADQIDYKFIIEEVGKTREEIATMKEALTGENRRMELHPEKEDLRIGSTEVCVALNISKSTLKAHRDKGLYTYTKIGSRYYYSSREIEELLKLKKNKESQKRFGN